MRSVHLVQSTACIYCPKVKQLLLPKCPLGCPGSRIKRMNVQGRSWCGVCTPRTYINAGGDRHDPAQLNQLEALSQICKVEGD